MAKYKRKGRIKLSPRQRLERLADKQTAHDRVLDIKREYYEKVTKPEFEREIREKQVLEKQENKRIDEANRKKLQRQLDYTRHTSKKDKIRFIHPK
ncbi:MAG: hypothetical protein ACLT1L_06705 [Leuconostoc lactis]|uniref:hypothetical protein n=1 Tax=Leuconostoc lactis TaxID=1246 RepID=UPI00399151DE